MPHNFNFKQKSLDNGTPVWYLYVDDKKTTSHIIEMDISGAESPNASPEDKQGITFYTLNGVYTTLPCYENLEVAKSLLMNDYTQNITEDEDDIFLDGAMLVPSVTYNKFDQKRILRLEDRRNKERQLILLKVRRNDEDAQEALDNLRAKYGHLIRLAVNRMNNEVIHVEPEGEDTELFNYIMSKGEHQVPEPSEEEKLEEELSEECQVARHRGTDWSLHAQVTIRNEG
jgi:hypothetical protein